METPCILVKPGSKKTFEVVDDCDEFVQEQLEEDLKQLPDFKGKDNISSANLRKRSPSQNTNRRPSTIESLGQLENPIISENHPASKNPFLDEIEEVEYFDVPPEPQPLMEVSRSSFHPQPNSAASSKCQKLDMLYYIYRVLHAVLNLMLIMFLILSLYGFVWLIKNDITRLIKEHKQGIFKEIARCQEEFVRYECGPALDTPALKTYCDQLDACRNEDMDDLPLAQISVKALASILNGFFNELSYKSMAFFIIFMTVWIFASAILSWLLRPTPEYISTPVIYKPSTSSSIPRTPSKRVRHYFYQPMTEPDHKRHLRTSRVATPTYSDYLDSEHDVS